MNLFDLLHKDPNLAPAFRRIFSPTPLEQEQDQEKRDEIDCFDARLDAMPEPLGGDE